MRSLLISLMVFFVGNAQAQAIKGTAPKNIELIQRYAGTYNYDGLLKEPFVQSQLRLLLGKEFSHFVENMSGVRYPIDLIDLALSANGARNDQPVRENAVICVETGSLKVHVGIFSDSAMTIYTPEKNYRYLPSCLTRWVYLSIEHGDNPRTPPPQGDSEFTFTHKVVGNDK